MKGRGRTAGAKAAKPGNPAKPGRAAKPATAATAATEPNSVCPRFHRAVELVGRKWTGAILYVLLKGPARFGELKERVPELSDRLLSERLKELEDEGIVEREVSDARPPCVTYRLTDRGRGLRPALDALGAWAERWIRK